MVNPLDRQVWDLPVVSITIERSGVSVATYAEQIPTAGRHAADATLAIVINIRPGQIVPDGTPDPEPELPSDDTESDIEVQTFLSIDR